MALSEGLSMCRISSWSLVCFYLLASQKYLRRRLVISGKTVRADLAKAKTLKYAPTIFTCKEGNPVPPFLLSTPAMDTASKPNKLHERPAGNIYASPSTPW